ncbi:uncharacterized protein LOC143512352 [Brachyhypopomus gauderio]|uniref:uncharacterized protein LOC143512352 n=1 Tax=Brachyhypopomus gauderio TaxID=698409 RepID=UPI0040427F75
MEDAGSIPETHKSSTPTTVDTSGDLHVEVLQTLKEPDSQSPGVVAVADDSVFYSEDEEIPRPEDDTSAFVGAVWPAGFESTSQDLDLGNEESGRSVRGSVGINEEGPKMKTEPAADSIAARTDELLAARQVTSATGAAAQLRLEDTTQVEKSVQAHVQTEAPADLQSEHARGTQGESSDALERVGNITLTGSDPSGDERGAYLVSNGVGDRLNISFNHLSHEKYGTVSYKQIRRGHTRQRIQEFESRMQL